VNSYQHPDAVVKEEIYIETFDQDVQGTAEMIMKMKTQDVTAQEKQLIGTFPNTYTFSKNLSEKNLRDKKGNITLCIMRPSIIASTVDDPFPGWTDSISAAGGLTYMVGLGLMHHIQAYGGIKFDLVPVDIVSNQVILSTAWITSQPGAIEVFNCGTSHHNPLKLIEYKEYVMQSLRHLSFNKQVAHMWVNFIKDPKEYAMYKFLWEELPLGIIDFVSKLPLVGSAGLKK
jgi:hypothetical protein